MPVHELEQEGGSGFGVSHEGGEGGVRLGDQRAALGLQRPGRGGRRPGTPHDFKTREGELLTGAPHTHYSVGRWGQI
jgi:hypothetical protein